MKRVLIFSLTYHPFVGGAEIALKEITDRFPGSDYSFDMITLRFDGALPTLERMGNITVYRIGFTASSPRISDRSMPLSCRIAKAMFPLTACWKALLLHRTHRYELVWAMMANQAGFAALFFSLIRPSIPYVLELQDGRAVAHMRERRPILRIIWPLYRRLYARAAAIKTISHFIAEQARLMGYTGRIDVIPNGVDVRRFSEPIAADVAAQLKATFDKRMGDVFLFTASRLVLSRGVEDVIRALRHLPEYVKLLVAGDGEDRAVLEVIARESGVESRVIFAGHIAHDALPAHFAISDIFVRPSLIEGMGNAFIEAFAAGIPVVATPVGGIPDFLFDPVRTPEKEPTGVFCNVRDPESIARAVRRYLDDPQLVARVVGNAKNLAQEKYDWRMIAESQKHLFNTIAAKGITP